MPDDRRDSGAIIEIGAEGGSITVLSRLSATGTKEYSVQLRDQSLTLLSEDEGGGEIRRDSLWTENWNEVVKTLGRWPWPMLYPLYVDPEYRERILAAVRGFTRKDGQSAGASAIDRWKRACGLIDEVD